MQRSKVLVALAVLAIAACAQSTSTGPASPAGSSPPAVPPARPTVNLAPGDASAAAAPASTGAAAGTADATDAAAAADGDDQAIGVGAGSAEGPGDTDADAGAAAQFRSCKADSDCVAVNKNACCHNGWKEAVAASQKEAYAKSFTCPQAHPICPMYIVQDSRVAECDNGTHLCAMVKVEDIKCGGFHRNHHACPDGYHCQLAKPADLPGKCVN